MPQLTVVHREPFSVEFLAPAFSAANLWRLFSIVAIVLCTLLITFATQGLWRRTNTYLEQPIIDFRDRILFIFYNQNGHIEHFWSPFQELNSKWPDQLVMPSMEMNLRDFDGDWRPDEIYIRAVFRQTNGADFSLANISSIFYAIFFDVRLEKRAWIELESFPIFGHLQPLSSNFNELNIIAQLDFVQFEPLPWFGNLTVPQWNPPPSSIGVANNSEQSLDEQMDELIWQLRQNEAAQNYTLEIGRKAEHWRRRQFLLSNESNSSHQQNAKTFNFAFKARIREQILHYRTNGWEMLKWAWIQFLAIFIIVRAIFGWLSSFLYQNQILGTVEVAEHWMDGVGKKID